MDPAISGLFERQRQAGFPDFEGTDVAATIPVSDRLINELVAKMLPDGGKVREVQIQSEEGNRVTARIRLSGPTFLPAISVTIAIEDQPHLPDRPVLGLRLAQPSKFVAMAASTLPAMVTLPPGITMEDDRIRVDIRRLLADRNQAEWLAYLTDLKVTTRAGAIVLEIRAKVGPKAPAGT
jgi:hypothetical protein